MYVNSELFDFIKKSPSAYHTVETVSQALNALGYSELSEGEDWDLADGGRYYVKRNGTSIIAFRAKKLASGFMIAASHSDSPAFRLKMTPELRGAYTRLEVERYGGMIHYSWLDRPLSLAGRVIVRTKGGLSVRLCNLDKDVAVIPSVAIHLNRTVNEGYKFNPAVDLLPVTGCGARGIMAAVAESVGADEDSIVSHDLFLYNREEGRVIGVDEELIMSPRLDDLECVFASLRAFLNASETESVPVLAVFDNEEIGSDTKQGAASTFLYDVLSRIAGDNYRKMINGSLMLSADNAHARHPNHPELSDADNAPMLNGGVVIKWNANQKYATDGASMAIFSEICDKAGVKTQSYYNRADLPGGSTLGSIANTKVPIPTVDIGLAQLAMHSASETAGASDVSEMIKALRAFYATSLKRVGSEIIIEN